MQNPRVLGTTPFSSLYARVITAATVVITAYYRLSLPFFLLCLYLLYLLWSYYWTWTSCRSVEVKSLAKEKSVFAGETFSQVYSFINGWFLPLVRFGTNIKLPIEFHCVGDDTLCLNPVVKNEEHSVSPDYIYPSWQYFTSSYAWLREKKSVTVSLKIQANLRGVYWLPPLQFFGSDPSGLFRGTVEVGKDQFLHVFPHLKNTETLRRVMAFEEDGRNDIYGMEDRYEYQGIREYQPGDAVKSINWYATARSGSLRSNIYQRKDAANCLVALDMTMAGQSAYRGKSERVEDPILEEAVSLAAGIALFHLEQGIRTALFTNAPTLQWVRREGAGTNTPDLWLKRVRQITALDFATGDEQAEKILKFCAAIDENGRAYPEAQHELWSKIMEVPAHTIIYLLTLQSPPTAWNKIAKNGAPSSNPSLFYSAERLSGLATSIVKVINLSEVIK